MQLCEKLQSCASLLNTDKARHTKSVACDYVFSPLKVDSPSLQASIFPPKHPLKKLKPAENVRVKTHCFLPFIKILIN